MKKALLFLTVTSLGFSAISQKNFQTKVNAPVTSKITSVENLDLTDVKSNDPEQRSLTRSACNDKIKYVDRSGTPPSTNQIYLGGISGWTEVYQKYPGYTGQISRIDFQGGNFGATKTVTVKVHSLSGGIPSTTVLGSTTVNVTSASGEFGANFSSPISVTGGFAVSVYKPASATDSIYVYYQDEFTGDDFSYLNDGTTTYSIATAYSADVDMMIRPTIQYTYGAPTLTASPTSFCAGSSTFLDITANPSFPWTGTYTGVYNPGNPYGYSIDFGDASSPGTSYSATHTYATGGSYTATATVTYVGYTGTCTSNPATQMLTVNPAPIANFAWSSANLAVTFTNMSTGATSYGWIFGDAGTATAPSPVHNYAASGTYTVELTANGACGTNTFYSNITITDSTNAGNVGVVELEEGISTNIYPNPANGILNIDLSLVNAEITSLQIVDVNGQVVYAKELGSVLKTSQRIDLENFAQGLYFARIIHGGKVSGRKFIKN
jgi:hypothetical protein